MRTATYLIAAAACVIIPVLAYWTVKYEENDYSEPPAIERPDAQPPVPHAEPTPTRVTSFRTFVVTGYCSCRRCCGKADGITASGARASRGTIAASLPFGTVIDVPGYGRGVVRDRGGAIRGARLDLWFASHRQARKWGVQTLACEVLP